MSKESISTMIGATNSVILKELIKEKERKLESLQSKVEQLEKEKEELGWQYEELMKRRKQVRELERLARDILRKSPLHHSYNADGSHGIDTCRWCYFDSKLNKILEQR